MSLNGVLLLLSIVTQFIVFIQCKCTLNEQFSKEGFTDSENMTFCSTIGCRQEVLDYFSPGDIYRACSHNNKPRRYLNLFKLNMRLPSDRAYRSKACLKNGSFSQDCIWYLANMLRIPSDLRPKSDEYYLLECSDKFRQVALFVPSTNQSHVQIEGISNYDVLKTNISVHPSKLLKCNSACKETDVSLTTTSNEIRCTGNTCRVGILSSIAKIKCSDLVVWVSPDFSFLNNVYVHGTFDDQYFMNVRTNKRRNEFDAGEKLSCRAKNDRNALSASGFRINIDTNFSSTDLNERYIPIDTKSKIKVICYFGDSAVRNAFRYYPIETFTINILSKKITKLIGIYENVIVENQASNNHSYKFYADTELLCDKTYYRNSNARIQVYQTDYVDMPLSKSFCSYRSYCRKITELVSKWKIYFSIKVFFIMCHYGGIKPSTPAILYIQEKSTFDFVYFYPEFETKYFLPGFIFGCSGKHVDKVSLECLNCKPAEELYTYIADLTTVIFQIPRKYNFNVVLSFLCIVTLTDGSKEQKHKNFTIVNSYFIKLDDAHVFYSINDTVNCKAEITVNGNEGTKVKMPLWLKANDIIYKSNMIPYIFNRTHGIFYSYCCAILDDTFKLGFTELDRIYQCVNYFSLPVVRNYRVYYNLDFNLIFPGSILKCYFCVNYTNSIELVSKCKGKNRILGKLNIDITEPDNNFVVFNNIDEYKVPLGKLKRDNLSYYNIYDYIIRVNCRISPIRTTPVRRIIVKTCERHPPKIYVSPNDHSLLELGDIITCSTRSVLCLHKLHFKISVRVNKGPPIFLSNKVSFKLTRQFLGSNVAVLCEAGTVKPVSATRSYRVEGKPTNTSIVYESIFKKKRTVMLMYGDSLICTGGGFPEIRIQWVQHKGPSKLKVAESRILIGPYDFNGHYKLTCIASNSRGLVEITTKFEVFNPRTNHGMNNGYLLELLLPLFTAIYVIVQSLSLIVIFKENLDNYMYYQSLKSKKK